MNGTGPGWGDLTHDRGGVTLAPGETKRFDVSEPVPEYAIHEGFVFVSCDFGYAEVDIDNHAFADHEVAVPGGSAAIVGEVSYFPEGHGPGKPKQGVAGVWAILVSDGKRPTVDVRKTDAAGHFEFHGLDPRPEYRIYFLPPREWTITSQNPSAVDVRGPADQPAQLFIEAEPRS